MTFRVHKTLLQLFPSVDLTIPDPVLPTTESTQIRTSIAATFSGWQEISDQFRVTITPKKSDSRILFQCNLNVGIGTSNLNGESIYWGLKLYRKIGDGSFEEVEDANGIDDISTHNTIPMFTTHTLGTVETYDTWRKYLTTNVGGTYMDSPNTSEPITYTLYWASETLTPPISQHIYLNRPEQPHGRSAQTSSTMTVTEVFNS